MIGLFPWMPEVPKYLGTYQGKAGGTHYFLSCPFLLYRVSRPRVYSMSSSHHSRSIPSLLASLKPPHISSPELDRRVTAQTAADLPLAIDVCFGAIRKARQQDFVPDQKKATSWTPRANCRVPHRIPSSRVPTPYVRIPSNHTPDLIRPKFAC